MHNLQGLHLTTGPMFAGKSTEMLNRIKRLEIAGRKVWCFKPKTDTRTEGISSHDGAFRTAHTLDGAEAVYEILDLLPTLDVHALAFDEVQFMPIELVGIIQELGARYHILAAGLDLDAFGQPFEVTSKLMALAETIDKRKAVCTDHVHEDGKVYTCAREASRTQRIGEAGRPVTEGEVVVVGGEMLYEARCIECFVRVPMQRPALHAR
jgi:thymidine kinase